MQRTYLSAREASILSMIVRFRRIFNQNPGESEELLKDVSPAAREIGLALMSDDEPPERFKDVVELYRSWIKGCTEGCRKRFKQ